MTEKKKVTIACPAKHGLPWFWMGPMTELMTLNHPKFSFNFVMESGNNAIGISRNIIADSVIKSPENIWKLCMIDSDAHWTVKQLIQLIDHEEPFVAAPYVRKASGPVSWLMIRERGTDIREDGMMSCDYMGTHFHAFDVAALRKMCDFYPERHFSYDDLDGEFKNKKMCELFPIGLVGPNSPEGRIERIKRVMSSDITEASKLHDITEILTIMHPGETRMLGEDYSFSRLARKAGFKLWCDRNCDPVGHVGQISFPVGPNQLNSATEFPFSHESMKHLIDY